MNSVTEVHGQQPMPPDTPAEHENHLGEYWAVIVKRRRLIGIRGSVAVLIGALVSPISPSASVAYDCPAS